MGSRIRENPDHIFDCFCEIVIPSNRDETAWVIQKFPEDYSNQEVLKSIPQFAYPCEFAPEAVQHFSFVLTNIDSKWTFGFCRHAPNTPTCFVMLSYLPWHDTFYKLLNNVAELANKGAGDLWKFLDCLYNTEVPKPGLQLHFAYNNGQSEFIAQCPDHHKLPSMPENRNLMEYFSAISLNNMITIFASMLNERRILITSKKLSKLSACVQAANLLIYPMFWQHIFIPVLPIHLLDYLSAPMPFLIGVPTSTFNRVRTSEIGEVVILDADSDRIDTPFNDLEMMPSELVQSLKRSLKTVNCMLGDTVARAFLRSVVQLIGGYKEALDVRPGEKITFNREIFIKSRPSSMQPFLQKMLHLQIFQQFIEGRLNMLNSGQVCSDEFESEVNLYEDKSNAKFKVQYKEWATNMKKEGGAILKSMKNKANPAMKHAYKSVKHKSRKAYKEIRSKIHDIQIKEGEGYEHGGSNRYKKPHSAPASPTLNHRAFAVYNPDIIPKSQTTGQYLESASEENKISTRQYKLLDFGENDEDDDSVQSESNRSSPSLTMDKLNLDLMSDFEDIFQSCSLKARPSTSLMMRSPSPNPFASQGYTPSSAPVARREVTSNLSFCSESTSSSSSVTNVVTVNPPPIDRTLKPAKSVERSSSASAMASNHVVLSTTPKTGTVIKPFPTAPPRGRKRAEKDVNEAPLINLDDIETIFDPLLAKDVSTSKQLEPTPQPNVFQNTPPLAQPNIILQPNQQQQQQTGKTVWHPRQAMSVCPPNQAANIPLAYSLPNQMTHQLRPLSQPPVFYGQPLASQTNPFLNLSSSPQTSSNSASPFHQPQINGNSNSAKNIWCNFSSNENS